MLFFSRYNQICFASRGIPLRVYWPETALHRSYLLQKSFENRSSVDRSFQLQKFVFSGMHAPVTAQPIPATIPSFVPQARRPLTCIFLRTQPLPTKPRYHTTATEGQVAGSARNAVSPADMNEISNKALIAMLSHSKQDAQQVKAELSDMTQTLALEGGQQEMQYMSVLQGLLEHTVISEVEELDGMYKQAFDRIINQVAGSDWKLGMKGQSAEADQEPHFSTWEDVLNKKKGGSSSGSKQGPAASPSGSEAASHSKLSGVLDDAFYRLLGVAANASQADIKSAYRKAALKMHPDVSNAPDATQQFSQLSSAYDTLSDPTSRQLYNRYGPEGMKQHQGAQAGQGNARTAWDEFKPFKKENKRTKARAASQASTSSDGDGLDGASASNEGQPMTGDVVEYPLSEVVKQQLQDGRSHGVGLLVGRNKDRGDAKALPEEALGLCEVEPLRQEEPGSDRWMPDELGVSSFAQLQDLKTVPVTSFDARFDVWHLEAPLSEGCGGPELPEEVIL